jgi:hypothetical protein
MSNGNVYSFEVGFLRQYELYRKIFQKKERFAKPKDFRDNLSDAVERAMGQVVYHMQEYLRERKTENLGESFGIFMAVMRYGMTSGYFYMQEFIGSFSDVATSVTRNTEEMVGLLHRVDKSVHLSHMAQRCENIANSNRRNLPYNQYSVLMNEITMKLIEYQS